MIIEGAAITHIFEKKYKWIGLKPVCNLGFLRVLPGFYFDKWTRFDGVSKFFYTLGLGLSLFAWTSLTFEPLSKGLKYWFRKTNLSLKLLAQFDVCYNIFGFDSTSVQRRESSTWRIFLNNTISYFIWDKIC